MDLLIQLATFALLLLVGLVFGRAAEARHFRDLQRREAELAGVLVFNERTPPADRAYRESALVVGSVVVAEDYFKRAAAALRGLVGGRVTAYESLMDRGRREAILRMKEAARARGAGAVFNVRLETASLSEASGGAMFSAEFIAYGTALVE
jgi:uncharacterized protein YbjQ (UPF0145 family)